MKNFLLKYKATILAFLAYLFLCLFLTYPLLFNLNSHIPGGGGDSFLFLWNQWWVKYSITNLQNPYFTDFIGYPLKTSLVFHTLTFSNNLLSLPLQIFFPSVLAFNLIFILSLVTASLGMFTLLNYLFKNSYLSFIGGVFFTFNGFIFQEMQGHFQYTSVYFIPWFIYFFLKIFTEQKISNNIIAAIILALSFYNEFYYTVGLIIAGLIITFGLWLKDKKVIIQKLKSLAIFLAVWIMLCLPLLYLSIKTAAAKEYPLARLNQINLYTPDLRSFFIPSYLHQFFGQFFQNYYLSLGYHKSVVFLGFSLLIFSALGYLVYKKNQFLLSNKFWLFFVVIFLFLTLGPFVYLGGYIFDLDGIKFTIPLPYLIFYLLPFVKGILVPPRFIIFVYLGLIILSGFLFNKIFSRLPGRAMKFSLTSIILALFFMENIYLPLPLSYAEVPLFYRQLAKENNDYTILELPFALSTSFYTVGSIPVSSILEYYQSIHHKKIINGWISRVPNSYYNFYNKLVGLDYLINPAVSVDKEKVDKISGQAKGNFEKLKIKYIIIHPEYYNHQNLTNTISYLTTLYDKKPTLVEGMLVLQI
jgi:hypothetical protein